MLVWRLCSRKHVRSAFTGEGARRHGGRWNLPGTPVVYTAESLSLAALELFVNVDPAELPAGLVSFSAMIPPNVRMTSLALGRLPRNWRRYPAPSRLREIGTAWARDGHTAILSVPSAVIPEERLYLLNPAHPHFARIRIRKQRPFGFDPRLVARLQ